MLVTWFDDVITFTSEKDVLVKWFDNVITFTSEMCWFSDSMM